MNGDRGRGEQVAQVRLMRKKKGAEWKRSAVFPEEAYFSRPVIGKNKMTMRKGPSFSITVTREERSRKGRNARRKKRILPEVRRRKNET